MKKYSLALVENGKISVNDYLKYKVSHLKTYQYKPASGLKLVFMKGNYLFLTPKIPFWAFRFFGKLIKKIPNSEGMVKLDTMTPQTIVPLLKTLGKNNMIIGVQSPKSNFQFEIWGV